ncbi:MAG: hypothetical protein O3A00_22100 [Planctomycetota bacterium]|nr:hypothetical protein [Planctomycetota bacterium]
MASSTGKPGAVHFALIFFVMLSVILGVVAYMYYKEYTDGVAVVNKERQNVAVKAKALKKADSEVQLLKRLTGYPELEVGLNDATNPDTVHGAVLAQIQNLSKELAPASPIDDAAKLARELHQRLVSITKTSSDREVANTAIDGRISKINAEKQKIVDDHLAAKTTAEKRTEENVTEHAKIVQTKDANITQLQSEVTTEKRLHQEDVSRLTAQLDEKAQEVERLTKLNVLIQDKLEKIDNVSFEKPDGVIRTVDQQNGLAWINLGSSDRLTRGTTFSVYTKDNLGVGRRGAEDIKGAIEVTRIVGPHMAECRILDQSHYAPISKNDPIYTPLWEAGREMRFSFAGYIDMDGDGRHSAAERKLLHDVVSSNGGKIDNELNDEGELIGKGITVHTKFLVIGTLPEGQNTDPGKVKAETDMRKQFKELNNQARMNGVRRISLSDFLSWIGYVPKQRLWRPGENYPFKLKSGAASGSTDETIGDRSSSGQVTGAVGGRKAIEQPVSSGQTSGLFGGGNRYRGR